MQVLIRQAFCFEQEAKPIDGVLKVALRRCVALLLKSIEVVLYLLWIELRGQAPKVQGHTGNLAAVVGKGAGATAKQGDIALHALQHCRKAAHFTRGTVEVLVTPYCFRGFFFVAIVNSNFDEY